MGESGGKHRHPSRSIIPANFMSVRYKVLIRVCGAGLLFIRSGLINSVRAYRKERQNLGKAAQIGT